MGITVNDSTGLFPLRPGVMVTITHPRHAYAGRIGYVSHVARENRKGGRRIGVWVTLQDGTVVRCGNRSLTVTPKSK